VAQVTPDLATGKVRGLTPAITRLVGRERDVDRVVTMVQEYRWVTITGPGGVGKTRLAAEIARRVASQFADSVQWVELAAVADPANVPAAVASVLRVQQATGLSLTESLAGLLARQQLFLVLDNCEHLLTGVAELWAGLLPFADDLRVLATSREPIGIAGEARYRLRPLAVPAIDTASGADEYAAVTLFNDRARQLDPDFELTEETSAMVSRIVARLDGMPLAIELAAARVEALGLRQLLDRLDNRFTLLTGGDPTAAARQRSLAAAVDWSYRLLTEPEQRVFRHLGVFPAPFTLDAARAVAGQSSESAVLRLVDCSLLTTLPVGADGRPRYALLETLRAFARDRLTDADEYEVAAQALTRFALQVADQAAAGLRSSTEEAAAARWLDAEEASVHQALSWALAHEAPVALRIAAALAPWWRLRGRSAAGREWLRRATDVSGPHDVGWYTAQYWLGFLTQVTSDFVTALGHFTMVCDASGPEPPPQDLVDGLVGRSGTLRNLGRLAEAVDDAHRALGLARQIGYPAGEVLALMQLSNAAHYADNAQQALKWAQEAQRIDPERLSGWVARRYTLYWALAMNDVGQGSEAQRSCAEMLTTAEAAGDLSDQADFHETIVYLARHTGHMPGVGDHLRKAIGLALRTNNPLRLIDCLDNCGHLCAANGRWTEAITLWAAFHAHNDALGVPDLPQDARQREVTRRKAAQALGAGPVRAAEQRGSTMTLETAAEFAAMQTQQDAAPATAPAGTRQLSAREQELVTLVAQGRTDAQIAGQLYISVRTVRSHLDRIRDKTGSRRRADLTRLALQAGLV
jgi:predicted ATPase/DNA-binding CsgD family transcriptional regulator